MRLNTRANLLVGGPEGGGRQRGEREEEGKGEGWAGLLLSLLLLMPWESSEEWENWGGSFQPGTGDTNHLSIAQAFLQLLVTQLTTIAKKAIT